MLLFTVSCKRNNTNVPSSADDNGGYASDASRIELANNDVISIADAAGTYYNADFIADGARVATDTLSSPHTLIIRFGPTDVVCFDGRKRSGSIIVSYDGQYSDSNKLHTITFDNYFIDDNQFDGTVRVTRVDTTITGNWYDKVNVAVTLNMSQYPVNSQIINWSGSLVRKWVGGFATGTRTDDAFSISGSATLTRANGHVFTFDIGTPIQFAMDCDYAESGVVNVSGYEGVRILNYGSGGCDPNAQVNINLNAYPIVLTK